MAQVISNSGHDDMIHDAVLDYYGRRLATCSSDKTIKIFEVEGDTHRLTETLKGHEGAVWCVSWAHPKFGTILASSSYDGKVLIWRESSPTSSTPQTTSSSNWTRIYDFALHTASVNLLSWSPHEVGCHLACASSDGLVSVLTFADDSQITHQIFPAHGTGVNAVSWAPAVAPGSMEKAAVAGSQNQGLVRRFATGGSDCAVRIWEFNAATSSYSSIAELSGHTGWVRDVAWSPSLLGGKAYIASASQDRTVRIWTSSDSTAAEGSWTCKVLTFECLVWRVSWSLSGNVLAVSGADNKVTLWKERVRDGGWECIKSIEE